jgi:hypothetical protein
MSRCRRVKSQVADAGGLCLAAETSEYPAPHTAWTTCANGEAGIECASEYRCHCIIMPLSIMPPLSCRSPESLLSCRRRDFAARLTLHVLKEWNRWGCEDGIGMQCGCLGRGLTSRWIVGRNPSLWLASLWELPASEVPRVVSELKPCQSMATRRRGQVHKTDVAARAIP